MPGTRPGMTVEGDAGAKPGEAPHAMKITAAVVPARSQPFEIHELDLAAPLADEVLVRIVASGLCHTDLHARDGYFPNLPYPLVCGHEGAGIVQAVGGAVLNVMQPREGQSIAVYGVGGVGLAGLMAARIAGCDPIIAVDRLPARLALARELGVTHTLESNGAETLREIRKITGGGTHFALETSAVPQIFRLAVDALRGLGACVLVGSARAGTEVAFEMPWLRGGRTVRGVIQGDSRPRDFIPRLVDFFMEGRFPLDRIVTRYALADINHAAADAASGATIKPVLTLPH